MSTSQGDKQKKVTEKQYKDMVYDKATGNHIWLNAFKCINPTDEFKKQLGEQILEMLNSRENLLPLSPITSENEHMREIAKLTPVLYLSINKS